MESPQPYVFSQTLCAMARVHVARLSLDSPLFWSFFITVRQILKWKLGFQASLATLDMAQPHMSLSSIHGVRGILPVPEDLHQVRRVLAILFGKLSKSLTSLANNSHKSC